METSNNKQQELEMKINPVLHYQPIGAKKEISVRMDVENCTVWLSSPQMADLFRVTSQAVSSSICTAYKQARMEVEKTHKVEKVKVGSCLKELKLYNLDVILFVGNEMNAERCSLFRQWTTQQLIELQMEKARIDIRKEIKAEFEQDIELLEHENEMLAESIQMAAKAAAERAEEAAKQEEAQQEMFQTPEVSADNSGKAVSVKVKLDEHELEVQVPIITD